MFSFFYIITTRNTTHQYTKYHQISRWILCVNLGDQKKVKNDEGNYVIKSPHLTDERTNPCIKVSVVCSFWYTSQSLLRASSLVNWSCIINCVLTFLRNKILRPNACMKTIMYEKGVFSRLITIQNVNDFG